MLFIFVVLISHPAQQPKEKALSVFISFASHPALSQVLTSIRTIWTILCFASCLSSMHAFIFLITLPVVLGQL
jgi:hypothetical protein